ncbi:DNA-binding transcriptional regulator, ArsR family [Salinihabitans flavidus]|uniref:DNA-binding transcriptional regulator, ArsR family n=1 Tax=Salinihabitans flavidus TaxID=569882 RepID=A0A1H8TNX1_9RHOB|nr:metalloregulator ArsR/SmtB family transcription factor [Salinihabitans flavidus]SEO92233.1 DNA-binding transcriptional regulator, ArsR family [Salinihabitans flavidus]
MEKNDALAAFAALSQPTRLDVIRHLIAAGEDGLLAGEIAERLSVRANTLSANLSILLQAGLVSKRREGRSIRYCAELDGLRALIGFLLQDCCGGRPELCQPLIESVGRASAPQNQNVMEGS